MGKKKFGPDDHRKAYEVWRRSGNMRAAADIVGCYYQTPFEWRKPDFNCPCPFHGWDQLREEHDAAMRALAVDGGETNPVVQEIIMRKALTEPVQRTLEAAPLAHKHTSDKERIAHLEVLYAKVFYDLTEIPLNFEQLKIKLAEHGEKLKQKEFFTKGKHVKSMDAGVRTLERIIHTIDRLRGIDRAPAKKPAGVASAAEIKKGKSVLADLRKRRLQILEGGKSDGIRSA